MSEQNLQRLSEALPVAGTRARQPLGRYLVEGGAITESQLVHALTLQERLDAPIGEILIAEGFAETRDVLAALSTQYGLQVAALDAPAPTAALCALMPTEFWLEYNLVPWMRLGPLVLVATARPDLFDAPRARLAAAGVTAIPVLAWRDEIDRAIARQFADSLAKAAETRVEPAQSCRNWDAVSRLPSVLVALLLVAVMVASPLPAFAALTVAAVVTLALFTALRVVGILGQLAGHALVNAPEPTGHRPGPESRLPRVSVLVPLYKEREIVGDLIPRLNRLTYPKTLLDVILVLEEKDRITRDTLAQAQLPPWMRVIEVPDSHGLTTKPRAMNYALDFCRGDIVGVWDAEDAPVADQIEHVVARFAQAPEDVVCLQGILDYYNPRTNWRSRCFTIEYCSWFRVVLPGMARFGLVIPLGGTTLFFRRKALEALGGWDAHNVTEDADLGVRLCRAGYRTEVFDTVTYEEANFRLWPWVRQRSRWLKGFMVTYLVHMRAPRKLLGELGLKRFLGVQAFFLGTVGQFLLAPVLWSFWLMLFGLPHPLAGVFPAGIITAMIGFFIFAEAVNLIVGLTAVSSERRRFLMPWVPTMVLYFPFGVIAAYKALWELAIKPYFWDKTQHGQAGEECVPG